MRAQRRKLLTLMERMSGGSREEMVFEPWVLINSQLWTYRPGRRSNRNEGLEAEVCPVPRNHEDLV